MAINRKHLFLIISVLFLFNCSLYAQNNYETGNVNRYRFYQPGGWGYKDKTGKIVLTPTFDNAGEFCDGWACVMECVNGRDCKFSYIDTSGKIMLRVSQFDEAANFSEGLAAVKVGFAWGYIDKTGKVVVKLQYSQVRDFNEGLAAVMLDGRNGYIDKTGTMVIAPQFAQVEDFNGGLAHVLVNFGCKWVYINKAGKIVMNWKFDKVNGSAGGLSRVLIAGKIGYINKMGQMVIKPQFTEAHDFSEGLACVKVGGKWGYINRVGKLVISPQFDTAKDFCDGMAAVTVVTAYLPHHPPGVYMCGGGRWDTKYGYINTTGNYLMFSVHSIFAI